MKLQLVWRRDSSVCSGGVSLDQFLDIQKTYLERCVNIITQLIDEFYKWNILWWFFLIHSLTINHLLKNVSK